MSAAVIILVIAFFVVFWTFAGYPMALWLIAGRRTRQITNTSVPLPVTIVIPTYNEARSIGAKLKNVRELAYPRDCVEIMVVDSASTDGTARLAKEADPDVLVIEEEKKLGKAHAINTVLPRARYDLVLITDANAYMAPDVLSKMTPIFNDLSVGGATGAMRQVNKANTAVSEGGGLYWKLEMFIRERESNIGSVIAMSGEASMFRRKLFLDDTGQPLLWYRPGATDDFEMTLSIIRKGYRVMFVPDAAVWEHAPDTAGDLFRQKTRIIVQTIVSVFRNIDLTVRTGVFGALIFPSRKILPLFTPFALITLYIGSAILSFSNVFWMIVLIIQTVCYLAAVLAVRPLQKVPLARLALFFTLLNGTILLAWFDLLRGKDYTSWLPIQSTRR